MYVGVSSVEIKSEADSNDSTEYPRDDVPSTGMFAVSHDTLFAVSCVDDLIQRLVCLLFLSCLRLSFVMFAVYFASCCHCVDILTSCI